MVFEIFFGVWFFVLLPIIGIMAVVNRFFGLMPAAVIGIGLALGIYGVFTAFVYSVINDLFNQHSTAVGMMWFFWLPVAILLVPKAYSNVMSLLWQRKQKEEEAKMAAAESAKPQYPNTRTPEPY